jgi:hypothetical protein
MMQQKTKYPSAFYAAAGVGDLVYERLRQLQTELRTKAIAFGNEQAPQWKRRVADLSVKVDAGKVRETVVTGTQAAAEKATQVYGTLVARGEKAFADEQPATAAKAAAKIASAPRSGASKTDNAKPGASKTDNAKPGASKTDNAKPDASKSDAAKPDAPKTTEKSAPAAKADAPVAKKAATPRKKAA